MTVEVQALLHSARPAELFDEFRNHAREPRANRPGLARAKRHDPAGQIAGMAGPSSPATMPAMPRTTYLHDGGNKAAWVLRVGQRFAWARELAATSQTQAARLLGTDQSTLSKIEEGKRLLPMSVALEACAKWGLSLDYLYRGKIGGHLRRDVEVRLVAAHPELVDGLDTDHPATAKVPAA